MANSKRKVSILGGVGGKILMIFVVVTVAGIGALALVAASRASSALMDQATSQLESVTELKRNLVENYLTTAKNLAMIVSQSTDGKRAIEELIVYHNEMGIGENDDFDITGDHDSLTYSYEYAWEDADRGLHGFVTQAGFDDLLIICYPHGHVMYSHLREADLGANLAVGEFKDTALAEVWRVARDSDEPVFVDMSLYAPSNYEPVMFLGVSMRGDDGSRKGVAVLQFTPHQLDALVQEQAGLGETAESYLVGEDLLMRSDSTLDAAGRSVQASMGGTVAANGVDTEAAREGVAGNRGSGLIDDYLGEPVLSAWDTVELDGFNWAIVTEMNEAEVREPVTQLIMFIIYIGVAVVVVVIIISIIFSRSISKPLGAAAGVAGEIAEGNLTVAVAETKSRDEVGALTGSFTDMLGSLNDVLGQVSESVDQVNTGSEQVAQASQSLSQGSTEQASSLEEVTASLNEINSQSNQNSETASEASSVAKGALQSAAGGNEQMQSLIAAMGQINNSSDEISKVVKVIDDIAFQINLLALNANVEAARAGKYGKGFAVVADEVRNLAVRSAEAAKETTAMVEETTRNVDAGNKAAEATSTQLEEIVTGSTKVADFLEEIALASKEQA
ncbi:MAG: HAMP domain-containing protein, partial [Spirochaetales bacterium]|nr:HAMP domain-containing protein [Spirochaetales bacterium]